MHIPPTDPRDRFATKQPTWGNVLAAYALMAAVLLLLWAVSNPLAGAIALAAIVGLSVGARRAVRLIRCFQDCREFAVDLVGNVRITVTRTSPDSRVHGSCPTAPSCMKE